MIAACLLLVVASCTGIPTVKSSTTYEFGPDEIGRTPAAFTTGRPQEWAVAREVFGQGEGFVVVRKAPDPNPGDASFLLADGDASGPHPGAIMTGVMLAPDGFTQAAGLVTRYESAADYDRLVLDAQLGELRLERVGAETEILATAAIDSEPGRWYMIGLHQDDKNLTFLYGPVEKGENQNLDDVLQQPLDEYVVGRPGLWTDAGTTARFVGISRTVFNE